MTDSSKDLSVEERVSQVLRHLGVSRAHFAARNAPDWTGMAETFPEFISSMTLVCPLGFDPAVLRIVASRLLVFTGDSGNDAETVGRTLSEINDVKTITLSGYPSPNTYVDVAAERPEDIASGLVDFLDQMGRLHQTPTVELAEGAGEIAGISYQIQGSGPPLVLFPLSAAASQWDPVMARLTESYCVIALGGAELGMVGSLESRGRTPGYLGGLRSLLEEAQLQPGESVLEVGCGTGVLVRWMAQRSEGRNKVVGVDVNPYFLKEAAALVAREGMEDLAEFKEGSGEALPFPDASFDIALSSTVIQRLNAEKLLSEMVRVTKPGGRVAVLGHAHDMPRWINLPLGEALKSKIESPPWVTDRGHPEGCDDSSLYRRFNQLGLSNIRMFPHMASFDGGPRLQMLQTGILPGLNPEEAEEWRAAVAQAQAEGTFFIATPFHCAVGTKPGAVGTKPGAVGTKPGAVGTKP